MKRIILALSLLVLPLISEGAANWTPVTGDGQYAYMIDFSTITRDGVRKAWVLRNSTIPDGPPGHQSRSTVYLMLFNCSAETVGIKTELSYSGLGQVGDLVNSVTSPTVDFRETAPNTMRRALLEAVCATR